MRRILIVRPDAIGDFIIFSAVLQKYSEIYQGAQIHLLCHPKVRDMALGIPFVHKVYALNVFRLGHKKYLPSTAFTLARLNLNGYDKIIYPVYSPVKAADDFIKCIRAKEKICFEGDVSNNSFEDRKRRKDIYTTSIDCEQGDKCEFDRNVEFVSKLGASIQGALKTRIWFLPSDESRFDQLGRQEGLAEKKYICLFPGAGEEIKYWSSARWIELVKQLLDLYPENYMVILGSGNDLKTISQIMREFQDQQRIVNLYNKTELRLLAKVIEHSSLLVGMDTGAVHIAAAVNTPNVCIMGGGHFGRFYPYGDLSRNRIVYHKMDCYGCNWKCIYDVARCIKEIGVGDVLQEVGVLMKERGCSFRDPSLRSG